jgi:hypothetical protein
MSKKFSILFTIFNLLVLAALSVVIVTQAQKTTPQKKAVADKGELII